MCTDSSLCFGGFVHVDRYRDVLARAIAWSTSNRSENNDVHTKALIGMLACLLSRAPRVDDGRAAASAPSSVLRIRSPRGGGRARTAMAGAGAAGAPRPAATFWGDGGGAAAAAAASPGRGMCAHVEHGGSSGGVEGYSSGCKRREHLFDLDSEMADVGDAPDEMEAIRSAEREMLRASKRLRFGGNGYGGGGPF